MASAHICICSTPKKPPSRIPTAGSRPTSSVGNIAAETGTTLTLSGTTSSPAGTGSSSRRCPSNPAAALTVSATARQLWLKHNRKISPTIAGKPAPPNRLRQDPCSQSQSSVLSPQQNTSSPSQGPALVGWRQEEMDLLAEHPRKPPRAVVGLCWLMAWVRASLAVGTISPDLGLAASSHVMGRWLGPAKPAMLKRNTSKLAVLQNGRTLHDRLVVNNYFTSFLLCSPIIQKCNSAKSSSLPKVGTIREYLCERLIFLQPLLSEIHQVKHKTIAVA